MAAKVLGYFALYGYSENLKNLLLRKCLADFQIILQNCSCGYRLSDYTKPCWLVEKQGHQGVGCFALYSYSDNLKNLLQRRYLADFYINFVEMFLGCLSIIFHQAMLISFQI